MAAGAKDDDEDGETLADVLDDRLATCLKLVPALKIILTSRQKLTGLRSEPTPGLLPACCPACCPGHPNLLPGALYRERSMCMSLALQ
jgi:hypothetical protein